MKMGDVNDLETSMSFKASLVASSNSPFHHMEYGMRVVMLGHTCLMFGGFSREGTGHRISKFDRVKKRWTGVTPKNRHCSFGSIRLGFIVDDLLYAYTWDNNVRNHCFMAVNVILMEEWIPAGKDTCPQTGFGTSGSYVEARNEAILFGGKKLSTEIFVYNVARASWYSPEVSGTPPKARYNHGTCCTGQKMFIVGGLGPVRLDLHILDMRGNRFSWSTPVTNGYVPPRRTLFAVACNSHRIFIHGGYHARERFDMYSITENRWYKCLEGESSGKGFISVQGYHLENTDHCMVVADKKLLIFGGYDLVAATPLQIDPL